MWWYLTICTERYGGICHEKQQYQEVRRHGNTAARCREEGIPVGEKTLRRWVDEGKLPAVHTGRKILVSWQNLMDYLTVSV